MRMMTSVAVVFAFWASSTMAGEPALPPADGAVVKARLNTEAAVKNLLQPDRWGRFGQGFEREGNVFVCDNGADTKGRRGVSQTVELCQTRPEPIVAVVWSKAEGVTGSADSNYSLYLDLQYDDGTPLYGQAAPFSTGTHDWQRREVVVFPDKPVRRLSYYGLLREHGGKAWFRDASLQVIPTPEGAGVFDSVPVVRRLPPCEGFQVRDFAAKSDFVRIERQALGLKLDSQVVQQNGATWFDVTLSDTSGKDRAVTLVYAVPVQPQGLRWLEDPRTSTEVRPGREYSSTSTFHAGANGRLSRYPLGGVTGPRDGVALGIDMLRPAFYRIGYNASTQELFLAYDLGLTPEKPSARVRFCRFAFEPQWGFRAALGRYYDLLPEQFRCRTPEQGLWMPFARISKVRGWEDFGFKFKEGNDETKWDDEHGIITFRYTEPMTWWMAMPKDMARTPEAALAEARRLADEKRLPAARAFLASGYQNAAGEFPARLLDTPWCNGAVWSMNSMPGIAGEITHFKLNWNAELREKLYGPGRKGDLDGEYIDSSEGYVTDELDFRREHFAAADTPLTFDPQTARPAIFRGLIAFEYVRGIADDVHRMGKLMMANGAPSRLCWLMPLLEVAGTETDWHRAGRWRPMSEADLLYRRVLCKGKPYCFLMNTAFEEFSFELVEKYMKRSLAYGMFPGFFSHNASQGHYFTRPELYDRDRPLFKKYVPLCKRVAEAGWQPIPRATSSDPQVAVERFGERLWTVFNHAAEPREVTVTIDSPAPKSVRELVAGRALSSRDGKVVLRLDAEDVAVLECE